MPKYLVSLYYTASKGYEVEADNESQALEKAQAIEESEESFLEGISSLEYADGFVSEQFPA